MIYLDGVSVVIDSQHYVFHGALNAFVADNLAAHLVGGFKESFSWANVVVVWQLFHQYKFHIVKMTVNYGLQLNMKGNACSYGMMMPP